MKEIDTIEAEIELADRLAEEAHRGIFRNDGITPYISHPRAVSDAVPLRLKPAAKLHDVVEDTSFTLEDLRKEGITPFTLSIVSLLTKRSGQSNMQYWTNILTNPDAVVVKIADIKHNLSSNPSEHAKEKYARALALFAKHGYSI